MKVNKRRYKFWKNWELEEEHKPIIIKRHSMKIREMQKNKNKSNK